MNKENIVGLIAGLALGTMMVIGYPMGIVNLIGVVSALAFLIALGFMFIPAIFVGILHIVTGVDTFKSYNESIGLLYIALGITLLTDSFLIWSVFLGWV